MITKIDNDKFEIKTETIEEVSLSQLEQELANIEQLNDEIKKVNAWRMEQPAEFQKFILEQYPLPVDELQRKINDIKELKL